MKKDLQLKIQSWVDRELPESEARRVGEWVAHDAEASALAEELGSLKQAMFRNEATATLGESRDFYWSKIQRQIQREAGLRRDDATPWFARWRKYMAPALGLAALACLVLVAVRQAGTPTFDEISSTMDGMEAVTFHDQYSQMTIVWLQDSTPAAEEKPAQDQPESVIDM